MVTGWELQAKLIAASYACNVQRMRSHAHVGAHAEELLRRERSHTGDTQCQQRAGRGHRSAQRRSRAQMRSDSNARVGSARGHAGHVGDDDASCTQRPRRAVPREANSSLDDRRSSQRYVALQQLRGRGHSVYKGLGGAIERHRGDIGAVRSQRRRGRGAWWRCGCAS